MSFYVSTATFFLLHCDEWDRVVALPRHKFVTGATLLQLGKHLPFSPSPLRLNIFRLFVILSLTQLYPYSPEIFLFTTATFKYNYRAPLRQIGQEY